jgi:hypothetical protein
MLNQMNKSDRILLRNLSDLIEFHEDDDRFRIRFNHLGRRKGGF